MRYLLTMTAMFLLTFAAACEDLGDRAADDAEPADDTQVETDDADQAEFPEQDPREIAIEIRDALVDEDFNAAWELLVPEFHQLEANDSWIGTALNSQLQEARERNGAPDPETIPGDVDGWVVDEYKDFVVVRNAEIPPNAVVLRPVDGEWRWDPGDLLLVYSWVTSLPQELTEQIYIDPLMDQTPMDRQIDVLDEQGEVRPIGFRPHTLAVGEDRVDISLELGPQATGPAPHEITEHLRHDAEVPIENITWEAGGETGGVEIVWTNADFDDETVRFPAIPEGMGRPEPNYAFTFRLVDIPADASEATLRIEDIQVGPLGEDAPEGRDESVSISIEQTFELETSAGILVGEPEEIEMPSFAAPEEAIPHEALPPLPPEEDFEILAVEHERSDSDVEAYVRIDVGETSLPLQSDGEVSINGIFVWEDGQKTDARMIVDAGMNNVVEVRGRRTESPYDVDLSSLRFEGQLVRQLELDHDAMLQKDVLETEWGDFPILDVSGVYEEFVVVHYQPAGRRIIDRVLIEQNDIRASMQRRQFVQHKDSHPGLLDRLTTTTAIHEALDDAPVQVTASILQIDEDAELGIEDPD